MQIIVETASIPGFPVQILVSVLTAMQLVTGVRDRLLPRGGITREAHSKRGCRMQSFPLGGDCEGCFTDREAPAQAQTGGLPSH